MPSPSFQMRDPFNTFYIHYLFEDIIMGDNQEKSGLRLHWKSLMACSLITMSPFQYGVDFTMIGGFQAMVGFLKVNTRNFPNFHDY